MVTTPQGLNLHFLSGNSYYKDFSIFLLNLYATSKYFYYIYIDNKVVSIVNKKPDQDNVQYLHYHNLGSVDTITNNQGVVKQRISYKPFGEKIVTDFDSLFEVRRGYTGHEHIEEFNLIHMNGRVYDPTIGRFISADPNIANLFNSQNYNRYSYVENNPLRYVDPSGYFLEEAGDAISDFFDGVSDFFSGGETWDEAVEAADGLYLDNVESVFGKDARIRAKFALEANNFGYSFSEYENKINREIELNKKLSSHFKPFDYDMNSIVTTSALPQSIIFGFTLGKVIAKQLSKKGIKDYRNVKFTNKASTRSLNPTHEITASRKEFQTLKDDIKVNGIKEPIAYTKYKDRNYVLDGHHRLKVAKQLGIKEVPSIRVGLPYKGYKNAGDL